jgi:hypothetical protein
MEACAILFLLTGITTAAVAWVWLIVCAFRQGTLWGLCTLVLPPIGLVFALRHAERAIKPLVLMVVGSLFGLVPVGYSLVAPLDLRVQGQSSTEVNVWSFATSFVQSDAAHEWMDERAIYLQFLGLATAVLAWIWLIVRAFRQRLVWGWGTLLVPPLGFVFGARYPRKGIAPLFFLLLGLLVAGSPALYTLYVPLNLGPREKLINGEKHLTLTGWDRKDYSVLKLKTDVVVLQMANPDVTDEVLVSLRGMRALQELDLNGTQVTDTGLQVLRDLPALATLRLAKTKITDTGFRDTLFSKASLMQLDLRSTHVDRETIQAWRNARSGRRALH